MRPPSTTSTTVPMRMPPSSLISTVSQVTLVKPGWPLNASAVMPCARWGVATERAVSCFGILRLRASDRQSCFAVQSTFQLWRVRAGQVQSGPLLAPYRTHRCASRGASACCSSIPRPRSDRDQCPTKAGSLAVLDNSGCAAVAGVGTFSDSAVCLPVDRCGQPREAGLALRSAVA
jgi:hypothetical protein